MASVLVAFVSIARLRGFTRQRNNGGTLCGLFRLCTPPVKAALFPFLGFTEATDLLLHANGRG